MKIYIEDKNAYVDFPDGTPQEEIQRSVKNTFYRTPEYEREEYENPRGIIERGNIDLSSMPIVRNQDGSVSTVRSISVGTERGEALIPTISDDGKLLSDEEAIAAFNTSGKHLGIFSGINEATEYADVLHRKQDEFAKAKVAAEEAKIFNKQFGLLSLQKGAAKGFASLPGSVGAMGMTIAEGMLGYNPASTAGGVDYEAKRFSGMVLDDAGQPIKIFADVKQQQRARSWIQGERAFLEGMFSNAQSLYKKNKAFIDQNFSEEQSAAGRFLTDVGQGASSIATAIAVNAAVPVPGSGGFALGFQEAAGNSAEAMEQGYSHDKRMRAVALETVALGTLESVGLGSILGASGGMKGAVKAFISEGSTEFLQSESSVAIKNITGMDPRTLFEAVTSNLPQAAYEGIIGGVIGFTGAHVEMIATHDEIEGRLIKNIGLSAGQAEKAANDIVSSMMKGTAKTINNAAAAKVQEEIDGAKAAAIPVEPDQSLALLVEDAKKFQNFSEFRENAKVDISEDDVKALGYADKSVMLDKVFAWAKYSQQKEQDDAAAEMRKKEFERLAGQKWLFSEFFEVPAGRVSSLSAATASAKKQTAPTKKSTKIQSHSSVASEALFFDTAEEYVAAKEQAASQRKLPENLRRAKPRYNMGKKSFVPAFSSDVDLALYITAQTNKSSKDAEYRAFLKGLGMSDAEIFDGGKRVRSYIKELASKEQGGTNQEPQVIKIPALSSKGALSVEAKQALFKEWELSRKLSESEVDTQDARADALAEEVQQAKLDAIEKVDALIAMEGEVSEASAVYDAIRRNGRIAHFKSGNWAGEVNDMPKQLRNDAEESSHFRWITAPDGTRKRITVKREGGKDVEKMLEALHEEGLLKNITDPQDFLDYIFNEVIPARPWDEKGNVTLEHLKATKKALKKAIDGKQELTDSEKELIASFDTWTSLQEEHEYLRASDEERAVAAEMAQDIDNEEDSISFAHTLGYLDEEIAAAKEESWQDVQPEQKEVVVFGERSQVEVPYAPRFEPEKVVVKPSRQAERTAEKNAIPVGQDISSYEVMPNKTSMENARDFIERFPVEARQVAMGEKDAPEGLLSNAVYIAYKNMLEAAGDYDGARMFVRQNERVRETTRYGQETQVLSQDDPGSAINAMTEISAARMAAFEENTGVSAEEELKKGVDELDEFILSQDNLLGEEDWDILDTDEFKCGDE